MLVSVMFAFYRTLHIYLSFMLVSCSTRFAIYMYMYCVAQNFFTGVIFCRSTFLYFAANFYDCKLHFFF